MSDTVQQIKERLSIVDVVQPYVKLTRAGRYWKGLSPFTKEKTPSFFVTPDRGLYHCFSSGKGGDMFSFIEEMEGVDFKGALKILADKAGIELVPEKPGVRDEREAVYACLDAARQYFESILAGREDVKEYLEKRGVTMQLVEKWSVGYAPKEWQSLKDTLTQKGFTESTQEAAGLIKRPDVGDKPEAGAPRFYDRFRGRIMFPIRDVSGRVIAFSGRIFEDDALHPQAKYLNSPEGMVFDKSRALFGIHEAKNGIRELGFSLLVEGQVDLIMVQSLGFKNAVATSGTAFTPAHAEILARYSPNLLISYDGDAAGVKAAGRAAAVTLPRGMNVKVVALPAGVDPADLIHTDAGAFREAVKKAEPVVDFFLNHLKKTIPDSRAFRLEVGKVVLPFVALMSNALDQSHFVSRIAEVLMVPIDTVMVELKKILVARSQAPGGILVGDSFLSDDKGEKLKYGILLAFEEAGDPRAEAMRDLFVSSFGQDRLNEMRNLPEGELEAIRIIASENFFVLHPEREDQEKFITELQNESRIINKTNKDAYALLLQKHREAEKTGNTEEATRLMEELNELSKKLK